MANWVLRETSRSKCLLCASPKALLPVSHSSYSNFIYYTSGPTRSASILKLRGGKGS